MKKIDESALADYLKQTLSKLPYSRRLYPWFQGVVTAVTTSGAVSQVQIQRTGEGASDGGTYAIAQPGYRPQVGDTVDLQWRDDDTAYVMAPRQGVGGGAPWGGWVHWSRYVVGSGGSVDTSSNPGGDIPLPVGFNHAWVIVSNAVDTGAGTSGSFGGLQLGVAGGAINSGANYVWTDKDVFTNTSGVTSEGITGSPNAQDSSWASFVLTGGGTGASWPSSANIYLPLYSNRTAHATAFWDILQVNTSTVARRMGGGYFAGAVGAVTSLHFFARTNHLAAGVTFDLLVST